MPVVASAAAQRAAAVLTCLSTSGREMTLTEIATSIGANKTTCQSVLLALVETGYVERDETRKTYRLGPAVLALATAIGAPQEALARARVAMEEISADLDVETTATVATDREILKVAQVPRPRLAGVALRPGQAVPLAGPRGAAHIAWAGPRALQRWLERGGIAPRSAAGRRVLEDLALVRERGFAAMPRREATPVAGARPAVPGATQVRDIGRSARGVRQVTAPVFGPDGRVLLVLGILEHDEVDATTLRAHVDRLLDATSAITGAIGGRSPRAASDD